MEICHRRADLFLSGNRWRRRDAVGLGRQQPVRGKCGARRSGSIATAGPIFSSPAIGSEGSIYVGSNDGSLYAIH